MTLVIKEFYDSVQGITKVSVVEDGIFPNPFMQFDISDELLVRSDDQLALKLDRISKDSEEFFGQRVFFDTKHGKLTAHYE